MGGLQQLLVGSPDSITNTMTGWKLPPPPSAVNKVQSTRPNNAPTAQKPTNTPVSQALPADLFSGGQMPPNSALPSQFQTNPNSNNFYSNIVPQQTSTPYFPPSIPTPGNFNDFSAPSVGVLPPQQSVPAQNFNSNDYGNPFLHSGVQQAVYSQPQPNYPVQQNAYGQTFSQQQNIQQPNPPFNQFSQPNTTSQFQNYPMNPNANFSQPQYQPAANGQPMYPSLNHLQQTNTPQNYAPQPVQQNPPVNPQQAQGGIYPQAIPAAQSNGPTSYNQPNPYAQPSQTNGTQQPSQAQGFNGQPSAPQPNLQPATQPQAQQPDNDIIVTYQKSTYRIDLKQLNTVGDLRAKAAAAAGVDPKRTNIFFASQVLRDDSKRLSDMPVRPGTKFMMTATAEGDFASKPQVASPPPQQKTMSGADMISNILDEVNIGLLPQVEDFCKSKGVVDEAKRKDIHRKLAEFLLQKQLKFDGIEGDDQVRQRRREGVRYVQSLLDRLDSALDDHQQHTVSKVCADASTGTPNPLSLEIDLMWTHGPSTFPLSFHLNCQIWTTRLSMCQLTVWVWRPTLIPNSPDSPDQWEISTAGPPSPHRSSHQTAEEMEHHNTDGCLRGGGHKYSHLRYVNHGSYGHIISALQTPGDARVILKRIMKRDKQIAVSAEIQAGIKLKDVEGVCKLYNHFETPQHHWLVFERAPGMDLFQHLEQRQFKPFDERTARHIIRQTATILQQIHAHGCAHRDVKLENIMYCSVTRTITFIDFGLATLDPNWSHHSVGSVEYASPETLHAPSYSPVIADVWALGVTSYALLCGLFPFTVCETDLHRCRLTGYHPPPTFLDTNLPPKAEQLLRGMLEVDPLKRMSLSQVLAHPFLQKSPTKTACHMQTRASNSSFTAGVTKCTQCSEVNDVCKKPISGSFMQRDGKPLCEGCKAK
ncbi:hypothetical protein PROFUN_05322 [Planoprotostelium fungivorum]|uniref:Protein kinase domain-containing protein n=1 Tax=Planoprotostelium fungivorum TaxID=1890364 RepID=A0A2P6NR18_9EUKA|nr:hypothetical protein PROFUN_05322 [Planoprotostelium fungivorum]